MSLKALCVVVTVSLSHSNVSYEKYFCTPTIILFLSSPSPLIPICYPLFLFSLLSSSLFTILSFSLSLSHHHRRPPLSLELRSPTAMATILESIVVPRSSALPSATLSPIAASSVSSRTGRLGLPHFTGLKVRSALQTSRSVGSLTYGPAHRRRGSPSLSH